MLSSPAIGSDGTVYVGSEDNKLYALSGKSGIKLWEFETGSHVTSSPAIGSDGTVYVGSHDKKVYAIKTDSKGLAKSPWPMFGQNAQHTGRASATKTSSATPNRQLTLEEKDIIGTYENRGSYTYRYVLLENGIAKYLKSIDGTTTDLKWSIVDNELHIVWANGGVHVWKLNPDNSITIIAHILKGQRTDYPKRETFKKIK